MVKILHIRESWGDSAGNYFRMDEDSIRAMLIPLGITSSWTRNPPKKGDSAGNRQLIYADSDRQDQSARKILRTVTIPGSATSNPLYCRCQLVKNLNTKTSIKLKINVIRPIRNF
jgi:hypothetical protein